MGLSQRRTRCRACAADVWALRRAAWPFTRALQLGVTRVQSQPRMWSKWGCLYFQSAFRRWQCSCPRSCKRGGVSAGSNPRRRCTDSSRQGPGNFKTTPHLITCEIETPFEVRSERLRLRCPGPGSRARLKTARCNTRPRCVQPATCQMYNVAAMQPLLGLPQTGEIVVKTDDLGDSAAAVSGPA